MNHIPTNYKRGSWRPVSMNRDEKMRPRKITPYEHGRLQQWADFILQEQRERASERPKMWRRVAWCIWEGAIFIALASLWVYVCTM